MCFTQSLLISMLLTCNKHFPVTYGLVLDRTTEHHSLVMLTHNLAMTIL